MPIPFGDVEVVFIVVEDPTGLWRVRRDQPVKQQEQRALQSLAQPAMTAASLVDMGGIFGVIGPVAQAHHGREYASFVQPARHVFSVGPGLLLKPRTLRLAVLGKGARRGLSAPHSARVRGRPMP